MKPVNTATIEFLSRSSNEGFARTAVSGFLASLDPTVEELADIKTAVSEAVTNCIVHAYADRIGIVYIAADLYADGRVVIRIRDKGCGIPDVEKAMEPLFTTGGEDRAGLGFAVMQSLMDKVRVRSQVGKGTTVTMRRRLQRRLRERA